MAYSETVAARVREVLAPRQDIEEKKMFGGMAFMLGGHMCCGVSGEDLMLRVGPERAETALQSPHARIFDAIGRPMKGMVVVSRKGYDTDEELRGWIEMAIAFASSLPPKAG